MKSTPGNAPNTIAAHTPVEGGGLGFRALLQQNRPAVLRLARRFGVAEQDTEDVAQEVFLILHEKFPALRSHSDVFRVLCAITARVCSNHRRSVARCRLRGRAEPNVDTDNLPQALVRVPEDQVTLDEQRAAIVRAINRLGPGKRAVIALAMGGSLTAVEIGSTLRISTGTVASRLRAARREVSWALSRARTR